MIQVTGPDVCFSYITHIPHLGGDRAQWDTVGETQAEAICRPSSVYVIKFSYSSGSLLLLLRELLCFQINPVRERDPPVERTACPQLKVTFTVNS